MQNSKNEQQRIHHGIILGLLVIFGLSALIILQGIGSQGTINASQQGITTRGDGFVEVKPDIAQVSLGIELDAPSAAAASEKNALQMTKLTGALKSLGIAEKDIQTTNYNLFPVRRYNKTTQREELVGYRVSNQVTVTVRNLDKLGRAIDQSIQAGATNVNNVAFTVASPSKWRNEAIAKAVADADGKAKALAKASGVQIKKILYITDQTVEVQPFQMDGRNLKLESQQANTPIEPGQVRVTANVQMGFEI